jgi:hypothetical protein
MTTATSKAKARPVGRAPYSRGTKQGRFDLDVYTVRELVERTGLAHETITKAARTSQLPGRNFEGTAGWRFTYAGVMWWLAGSPGDFDPVLWAAAALEEAS